MACFSRCEARGAARSVSILERHSTPTGALDLPSLRKARSIRPGARIGIAAPAGPIDSERLTAGEALIRELGFEPVSRPDILDRSGYLAGSDERRAAELAQWVDDPDVAAIWCARGGYGTSRILGMLSPERFRSARKPLVGYSDISSLLLWQRRRAGLMGIHGPMFDGPGALSSEAVGSLLYGLTGRGSKPVFSGRAVVGGRGTGRLIGGSLSLVVASLGTPWEITTSGAILMLEEVTEAPYRIDRMLDQLKAAGKFDRVMGVGIGEMTHCEDDRYPERDVETVLRECLEPLGVPLVFDLPFGHGGRNLAWPHGARAWIDGDRGELELLESAVSSR